LCVNYIAGISSAPLVGVAGGCGGVAGPVDSACACVKHFGAVNV